MDYFYRHCRGTYFDMIQEQQKAAGWEVAGELIPN